jgi:hypothetical protein
MPNSHISNRIQHIGFKWFSPIAVPNPTGQNNIFKDTVERYSHTLTSEQKKTIQQSRLSQDVKQLERKVFAQSEATSRAASEGIMLKMARLLSIL